MSLTIELLPDQEQRIQEEAERAGISVDELVRRALDASFFTSADDANQLRDKERAEEESLFEQLHANMNETRQALGMRTL